MTNAGIAGEEADTGLHRSSHHDERDDQERNTENEADQSKHHATHNLDDVVGDAVANRPDCALDTLSRLNRPVVIGERITDHAQDCSEVALYSAPCAEI